MLDKAFHLIILFGIGGAGPPVAADGGDRCGNRIRCGDGGCRRVGNVAGTKSGTAVVPDGG